MKNILIHSCCGPCSTSVIEKLKKEYNVTIFYSNSNIYPQSEYIKRLDEQKRYAKIVDVDVIEDDYDEEEYLQFVSGLEGEKEGGSRCDKCFEFRLRKTAKIARERGFDLFTTTLSVSPHKNHILINQIGEKIAKEEGIPFLAGNFKKEDGYKRSIEISKQYDLYRQNYCGCRFSIRKDN